MGIKDLFNRDANAGIVSLTSKSGAAEDLESPEYYSARIEEKNRFEPHVDYSIPMNFAKFGSAEKYYYDAITNIYTYYPFDGSFFERTEWELSASGIQRYVFDQLYPRTHGYVDFSYGVWGTTVSQVGFADTPITDWQYPTDVEYITIYGGPNKDPDGSGKTLANIFENSSSNFYNASEDRESNLEMGPAGNTVEFWMKKDDWLTPAVPGSNRQEVVFDLWASGSTSAAGNYGRFAITLNSCSLGSSPYSPIHLTYMSGAYTAFPLPMVGDGIFAGFSGSNAPTTASLADGQWHHYAISVDAAVGRAELYVDGVYKDYVLGSGISEVTGALIANIGSYYNQLPDRGLAVLGVQPNPGWSKLSASMDEFRFWKTARTDKQIGMNWFTQVGGGTNEDDANTDLGVYYKFNEGISLTASVDARVLDYSGRFSDGTWTGYTAGARNTGSAMILAGAADKEFRDPIIYSFHPEVVSLLASKTDLGKQYDHMNAASIYYSIPSWIVDEDEEAGGNLLNLTQIISQYFDSVYLYTQELPRLKDIQYLSASDKPYPFTNKSLESLGFVTPDLFIEGDVLELIASRNNTEEFDKQIWNVKNLIYQNIYNNLIYIYKTKGTMKSFRNLLRCYGIDEELVRVNLYVDDATYEIRDNYKLSALEKKFVNFAGSDRFNGTVYQTSSNAAIEDAYLPIAGHGVGGDPIEHPITFETQIMVPSKFPISSDLYFDTPFISASLFGQHEVDPDYNDYTWDPVSVLPDGTDDAEFQVYLVKEELGSSNGKFVLTSVNGSSLPDLESPVYTDIYDNTHWNIAVKVYPSYALEQNPSLGGVEGIVEFQGVQTEGDIIRNEFVVTSSIGAPYSKFVASPSHFYVGAHYTNFTGTILEQTDVKITNNRVWYSYLPPEVIRVHAKDSTNYGTKFPYNDAVAAYAEVSASIPEIETLALWWGYDNLSSSDGGSGPGYTAGFTVTDLHTSSADRNYGLFGNILTSSHPGRGDFFLANDTDVIQKEYLSNAKLQSVETVQSDDLVEIITTNDNEEFNTVGRPLNYVYAIEKGMQQVISDEMINVFGSIVDFNNLIGEPVNRYQQNYHRMGKLRQIFFSRIKNTPSLIKYVEFYKWIDGAITSMIAQLIPASADFSDKVSTVIESHILERNKYWNKFPTIELEDDPPVGIVRGINELLYPWKTGHGPIGSAQNQNCYWWKNRAEFHGSDREGILSSSHESFDKQLDTTIRVAAKRMDVTTSGVIELDITRQTTKFGTGGYLSISTGSFIEADCLDDT